MAKTLISLVRDLAADAKFREGASAMQIAAAEDAIGLKLPKALKAVLSESDGIEADFGAGIIWPCSKLVQRNLEFRRSNPFRELYMPFDHLLFIGDDGGGDQFAFAIVANGEIAKRDIYRWDHETDGRVWFSRDLGQYVERRMSSAYREQR